MLGSESHEQEISGRVTDFDGKAYWLGRPLVLASNGKVHEEMRQVADEIAAKSH